MIHEIQIWFRGNNNSTCQNAKRSTKVTKSYQIVNKTWQITIQNSLWYNSWDTDFNLWSSGALNVWSVKWYYTLVEHFNCTGGTGMWQGRLQSSNSTRENIKKADSDSSARSDRRWRVFTIHQRSQRLEGFQVFLLKDCTFLTRVWWSFSVSVLLRNLFELMFPAQAHFCVNILWNTLKTKGFLSQNIWSTSDQPQENKMQNGIFNTWACTYSTQHICYCIFNYFRILNEWDLLLELVLNQDTICIIYRCIQNHTFSPPRLQSQFEWLP